MAPPVFKRGTTLVNFYKLPWITQPFSKGSTHKGKNLLLEEQMLSFKS